ncbi:MAG: reverse transcriptase domain-containing protein [Planctomycetota bacterium]|nr:reverse transcriptase domain-containing protein [Planctomycetota bacterium]
MSLELQQSAAALRERFFALETREAVANLLEIKYNHLMWCVYRVPLSQRYTHFSLPKKSGGNRTIMAPVSTLKLVQRKLSQVLNAVYKPKPSAHGFLRGRSIVTNAKQHAGSKYVLNLDLKDFFPSINYGRVRGMFMGTPYKRNPSVATLLAAICCADNQLPQGAPTSPIVSNMICAKMDSQLQKLAEENRCFYTRYADDITFSTDARRFPQSLVIALPGDELGPVTVGPALLSVIQSNGFEINANKVRLQGRGVRQEVTGLTTNRLPNVQRRFAAQIRAMLHAWERYGLDQAEKEFLAKYDHYLAPNTARCSNGIAAGS